MRIAAYFPKTSGEAPAFSLSSMRSFCCYSHRVHGGPTSESLKGWRNVKIRRGATGTLLVEMILLAPARKDLLAETLVNVAILQNEAMEIWMMK